MEYNNTMTNWVKDINDMHVAENPKPLKPLIIEAINTVKIIKATSIKLS